MLKKILPLCLCLFLLAACAPSPEMQHFTCEELTLSLPSSFQKIGKESYDFFYSSGNIAVLGIKELKKDIETYIKDPSAQAYACLLQRQTGSLEEPVRQGDFWSFSYNAVSEGTELAYVTAVFEAKDGYWAVQTYCTAEKYPSCKQEMQEILENIQMKTN